MLFLSILFLLQPVQNKPDHELPLLVEAGQEEGWQLNNWQVVNIDQLTENEFETFMNNLQNDYKATIIKDENAVKYTFEYKKSVEEITHAFHAVKSSDKITIQTIIYGQNWNHTVQDYFDKLTNSLQKAYKLKFTKNFTCLYFEESGIINGGFTIDEFWQKMKIKREFEQYDNVQHSTYERELYGYSPLWNNEMVVDQAKINVQMTIKQDDEHKKQIIIGTPMILNEY